LRFVVSTDAHSVPELRNVRYGTAMARRGWIERGEVLNTRSAQEFVKLVAPAADGRAGVFVITPTDGLRPADEPVDLARLRRFATVDIAGDDPRYREPLDRDARQLARRIGPEGEVVLLGSIATGKYVEPLLAV